MIVVGWDESHSIGMTKLGRGPIDHPCWRSFEGRIFAALEQRDRTCSFRNGEQQFLAHIRERQVVRISKTYDLLLRLTLKWAVGSLAKEQNGVTVCGRYTEHIARG